MRALRVVLAMILTGGPVQAQPVVELLSRYSVRADEAASQAPEGDAAPGSGKQLAALEASLALLSEGLEGFADSGDADKALLSARPRLPSGTAPFFKDRSTALRALYRTLAVTDYTWALRFPNPPCSPAARRSALLRSADGLFMDPASGKTSAWMSALLGPTAEGKGLESALDEASASMMPSEIESARLRGYDVADDWFVSGLTNCGYALDAKKGLSARYGKALNEYGLFSGVAEAGLFRAESDGRISEHAPFNVFGLWAYGGK